MSELPNVSEHKPHGCPCVGDGLRIRLGTDLRSRAIGLAVHSYKSPYSETYVGGLGEHDGQTVAVTHRFSGPTGLPYAYSATLSGSGYHVPALFVEEEIRGDPDTRASIIKSMARTLYVSSFADVCDDEELPGFTGGDERAGGGEDWFDTVTSDNPQSAINLAIKIAAEFESTNKRRLEVACAEWIALGGPGREGDENTFGHYLVMMSLGHGVGLWDDFPEPASGGFATGHYDYDASEWMGAETPESADASPSE